MIAARQPSGMPWAVAVSDSGACLAIALIGA
jgi:hypothetical protein